MALENNASNLKVPLIQTEALEVSEEHDSKMRVKTCPASSLQSHISPTPTVWLWIGMLIFASQSAILVKLVELGEDHKDDDEHNPISACNVLFIGNLLAAISNAVVFRGDLMRKNISAISPQRWVGLTVVTAIYSGAQFMQYESYVHSSPDFLVTLAIVLELEPVTTLCLTRIIFKEEQTLHTYIRNAVIVMGILVSVFLLPQLTGSGSFEPTPFFLMLATAFAFALSNSSGRILVKAVPIGIFIVFRTCVGAVLNFLIATSLYGPYHFAESWKPFVLGWMGCLLVQRYQKSIGWGHLVGCFGSFGCKSRFCSHYCTIKANPT